jgi:hypothetical protein
VSVYRILWTREGTEGGWWADVDAPDAAGAAWAQAVRATSDGERPPVLVGIAPVSD